MSRLTKVVELTGYNFGADPDHAAEIVWHVISTCAAKQLNAQEVAIRRTDLRITLDVTMVAGSELDEWLKSATAHLVSAVVVGAQAGRMRGEGVLAARLVDG
jgi:hypothetical protein